MRLIADLHIHSPFSRATSKDVSFQGLYRASRIKGINILGTGDILHPGWRMAAKESLVMLEQGLYGLKDELKKGAEEGLSKWDRSYHRFVLTGEISCIYKKGHKVRKVHHLLLFPEFEGVERLCTRLSRFGSLESDGRPILGLDSRDLLEMLLESCPSAILIPAHIWTPWFSLFGSNSGFDAIEECFEDLAAHIHALETGLSSDPPMNRLLSHLDAYSLVSNSDAHSLYKIGREATVFEFEGEISYYHMAKALETGNGLVGTLEFFPEEGKYHFDGHRACNVRTHPSQTLSLGGICPKCGKALTKGVLFRVQELADRTEAKKDKEYHSIVPLCEILGEILGTNPQSRVVQSQYFKLIEDLGPELEILTLESLEEIRRAGGPILGLAISRMREGKIMLEPGYDGQYGKVSLFRPEDLERLKGRRSIFELPEQREPKPTDFIKDKSGLETPQGEKAPLVQGSQGLNYEQRQAVEAPLSHLIIQAGPGTGKTTTLIYRIAHLVVNHGLDPSEVLCLTFTRKAKTELEKRLSKLIPNPESLTITTFHSFSMGLIRSFVSQLGLSDIHPIPVEGSRQALVELEGLKQGMPLSFGNEFSSVFSQVLEEFSQPFSMEGILSFLRFSLLPSPAIEPMALAILRWGKEDLANRIPHYKLVCVDEFQDTSPIELEILKAIISISGARLCVIGDQNQSIYGFRGALKDPVCQLESFLGGPIRLALNRNYRTTKNILEAANSLVPEGSPLITQNDDGERIRVVFFKDEYEEARFIMKEVQRLVGGTSFETLEPMDRDRAPIPFSEIAVLYRLNEIGERLAKDLNNMGIPIALTNRQLIVELPGADLIYYYLSTLAYPQNQYLRYCYERLLKKRGLRPKTHGNLELYDLSILVERAIKIHEIKIDKENQGIFDYILELAKEHRKGLISFLHELQFETYGEDKVTLGDRVALMTLHASKGLEWDVVFLCGVEEGVLPLTIFNDCDINEEKRLFYVGLTRARKLMYLLVNQRRRINSKPMKLSPSRFLSMLPKDILEVKKVAEEGKQQARMYKKRSIFPTPTFGG